MMIARRLLLALTLSAAMLAPAEAQRRRPGLPPPPPIIQTQAELVANAGSDTVHFTPGSIFLSPAAQTTLTVHARLLKANPALTAVIEGHSDPHDTRDHAFAMGERRASAVRDFLVALGVEAARLRVVSWGKERPVREDYSDMSLALSRRAVVRLDPPPIPVPPQPVPPATAPAQVR